MARKARLSVPGAVHHVMARGIEGRRIFCDNDDRHLFLSLLASGIQQCGFKCYAWVLMDNHYHIVLRLNERPLSMLMRKLNSKYARWYRKKYKGHGYLFQDRFKSIVTQDQGYIEQLVRYVHLNPLRSGTCKSLEELDTYPWSGHAVLLNNRGCVFQDTTAILRRFGRDINSAAREYRAYIRRGVETNEDLDFLEVLRKSNKDTVNRHEYNCWVIGDQDFVKKALVKDRSNRIRVASYKQEGWTVRKVVQRVAGQMGIEEKDIYKRGRNNNRSAFRKIVATISHRTFDIPVAEVARYYGVDSSTVSRMLDEGEFFTKKLKIKVER